MRERAIISAAPAANTTPAPAARVLVIDDDVTVRMLMRAALQKVGFDVSLADCGEQGLRLFNEQSCDLVMLDVDMPGLNGHEVCSRLRLLAGDLLPIVMVTGMEDAASVQAAYKNGATDFISKPINWALLRHRIRYVLRASKALDEFLALSYWKEKRLPVVIARLFNTVGPRQTGRYGMVLPNFVRQALEGSPVTVYGTGQQSRCFCDVRDAVEALLRLAATDKAVGEVVNVGNDHEVTIEDLARLVKVRTSSSSTIEYIPYDQAYEPGFEDMFRRVPCVEKLELLTGFRPQTPLPEIVDRVVSYVESKRAGTTPRMFEIPPARSVGEMRPEQVRSRR